MLLLCSLGCQKLFFLLELDLSGVVQVSNPLYALLNLQLFSQPGLSLAFLERSLCPDLVHLSLPISQLLLLLSHLLGLSFLLLLQLLLLLYPHGFLVQLGLVVSDNFFVFSLLLLNHLLLQSLSYFVRLFDGDLHSFHHLDLVAHLLFVFFDHCLLVLPHDGHLDLGLLVFANSVLASVSDLLHNDLSTPSPSFLPPQLAVLLSLHSLESLDLHHCVQLGLLSPVLSLKDFVLFDLFVPNGHHFGKHGELVHMLNIVELLVQHLHSVGQGT